METHGNSLKVRRPPDGIVIELLTPFNQAPRNINSALNFHRFVGYISLNIALAKCEVKSTEKSVTWIPSDSTDFFSHDMNMLKCSRRQDVPFV